MTTQQFILLWYCRSSSSGGWRKKKRFCWTAEFYSCRWTAGPGFALFAVFAGLVTVCLSRLGLGHHVEVDDRNRVRMSDKNRDPYKVKTSHDEALMTYLLFLKPPETDTSYLTNATALRIPEASRTDQSHPCRPNPSTGIMIQETILDQWYTHAGQRPHQVVVFRLKGRAGEGGDTEKGKSLSRGPLNSPNACISVTFYAFISKININYEILSQHCGFAV